MLFLGIGIIGIFVPLLPTTPFALLAVFFFSRSSKRFEKWIESHPLLGPPIKNWRIYGAISIRAKLLASLLILASLVYVIGFKIENASFQLLTLISLSVVLIFLWTRPSGH